MASGDVRFVERYNDLLTQQRRLRHLRSLAARNIKFPEDLSITYVQFHFSLHFKQNDPAFYVSEKIQGSLNPTWRSFNLYHICEDPFTLAKPSFVLRIWQTSEDTEKLIIEWEVDMFGLAFLGPKRDNITYTPNTLVFGLADGLYYAPTKPGPTESGDITRCFLKVDQAAMREGYSVSSLSRIQTVIRAKLQTHASVQRVHSLIEQRLVKSQNLTKKKCELEMLKLRLGQLRRDVESRTSQLQSERETVETKQANSHQKDIMLRTKFETLEKDKNRLHDKKSSYFDVREDLIKTGAQLVMRRKQLIMELASIYPIEELPDNKGYVICRIKLPNSEDFSGNDENSIDIALGFTCHLFMMISQFLDVPIRYFMEFLSSKSKIRNALIDDKYKEFPLHGKSQEKVLFNYGVYLLNKNIAQLRYYCGLGTTDLRLTLPNLKTLMELRLGVSLNGANAITSLPGQHIPVPPNLGGPQKLTSGIRREPFSANNLEKLVENAEAAAKFEQILSETKASYNHSKVSDPPQLTVLKNQVEGKKVVKDGHKRASSLGAVPYLHTKVLDRSSSPDDMLKGSPDSFFGAQGSPLRSRDSSLERMLDTVVPPVEEVRDSETGEGEKVLKTVPISGQPILVALQNCDQDSSSETEVNVSYGSRFKQLPVEKSESNVESNTETNSESNSESNNSKEPTQSGSELTNNEPKVNGEENPDVKPEGATANDQQLHDETSESHLGASNDNTSLSGSPNQNAEHNNPSSNQLLSDLSQANSSANQQVGNPPTADHMMGLLDHALEVFEDNDLEKTDDEDSTANDRSSGEYSSRDIEQRAAALSTLSSFKLTSKKSEDEETDQLSGANASDC